MVHRILVPVRRLWFRSQHFRLSIARVFGWISALCGPRRRRVYCVTVWGQTCCWLARRLSKVMCKTFFVIQYRRPFTQFLDELDHQWILADSIARKEILEKQIWSQSSIGMILGWFWAMNNRWTMSIEGDEYSGAVWKKFGNSISQIDRNELLFLFRTRWRCWSWRCSSGEHCVNAQNFSSIADDSFEKSPLWLLGCVKKLASACWERMLKERMLPDNYQ